jgi:hypothetical protein
MGDKNANTPMWIPITLCILFALLGIAYSFSLRFFGFISTEAAFLGFTCFFIFTAIVVYTLPQLQELAFGGWKMTLRKAEARIYAKEQIVQKLMLTLADLAQLDTLNVGQVAERVKSGRIGDAIREWRVKRIDQILSLVNATEDQKTLPIVWTVLMGFLDINVPSKGAGNTGCLSALPFVGVL